MFASLKLADFAQYMKNEQSNNRWALRVDSGLSLGNIYPVGVERTILGRSVDVPVPVDDGRASRVHAAVDFSHQRYLIVDLGSTNGTFLNGVRVVGARTLRIGDQIRIGSTVFIVELMDKAKLGAHKVWKETTRAILRDDLIAQSTLPANRAVPNVEVVTNAKTFEKPNEKHLAPIFTPNSFEESADIVDLSGAVLKKTAEYFHAITDKDSSYIGRHGRFLVALVCGILIFSAVVSSFR